MNGNRGIIKNVTNFLMESEDNMGIGVQRIMEGDYFPHLFQQLVVEWLK